MYDSLRFSTFSCSPSVFWVLSKISDAIKKRPTRSFLCTTYAVTPPLISKRLTDFNSAFLWRWEKIANRWHVKEEKKKNLKLYMKNKIKEPKLHWNKNFDSNCNIHLPCFYEYPLVCRVLINFVKVYCKNFFSKVIRSKHYVDKFCKKTLALVNRRISEIQNILIYLKINAFCID